jgi:Domain of Unknown Function with PDB structure (DUF3861)
MAKRGHSFTIFVAPQIAGEMTDTPPLTFDHVNHDDVIAIATRVRDRSGWAPDMAAATVIGLKLLASVALTNRDDPIFDNLRGPIRDFTRALKDRIATQAGSERSKA